MSARQIMIKHRQRKPREFSAEPIGVQLNSVLQAIETERDNLARAESVLGCLKVAMESDEMRADAPYYPDVAEIARQMLKRSINALDPINLPAPWRDKVKEEHGLMPSAAAPALDAQLPLLRERIFPTRRSALRIHRRHYSRAATSEASSRDSASANISG
jgi:hypothetical protein